MRVKLNSICPNGPIISFFQTLIDSLTKRKRDASPKTPASCLRIGRNLERRKRRPPATMIVECQSRRGILYRL
jgi:hypothetical protein